MNTKRIYLDYAASTPVCTEAVAEMQPYFVEKYGNASALHAEGITAKEAISHARGRVSRVLQAHSDEIVFTGSGTESNNLALQGVARKYRKEHNVLPHIIISAIEHPSVLDTAKRLEVCGEVTLGVLPVTALGIVDISALREELNENTALVSVMYANNEVGTIQPIKEIAKIVRAFKKRNNRDRSAYPYVHTDACQAANYLDMDVVGLGVDMLTINGSKLYGPKGVGALFVRRGVTLEPLIYGGTQEGGVRAGTENVPGIVGLGAAIEAASEIREKENERLSGLRDYFIKELQMNMKRIEINGDQVRRLPNNVHISIPGEDGDMIVIGMDARGVACSSRSACKSGDDGASHVMLALRGETPAMTDIRFSLGRNTTKKDIDSTVEALVDICAKYAT